MEKAIICDLDGTLANVEHRVRFVRGVVKNWHEFNAHIPDDTLNHWCKEIILAMKSAGYRILLVTGRGEENDEITKAWLQKFDVPYDQIFYRKNGDVREDDVVKEEIYLNHLKNQYQVLFVLEDRASVVAMWRDRLHLVCLQCDYGNF